MTTFTRRDLAIFLAAFVAAFGSCITDGADTLLHSPKVRKSATNHADILIVDPFSDPDDINLVTMWARWVKEGRVAPPAAVIATLRPAIERAELLKGVLNALDLPGVPVGVGSEMVGKPHPYVWAGLRSSGVELDGKALLIRTLEQAAPGSVRLFVMAGMRTPAEVAEEQPELFRRAVGKVVIMGGVKVADGQTVVLTEAGFIEPTQLVANNNFDLEAAKSLYRQCQLLGVSTITTTTFAAQAAKVSLAHYDQLAATGHPVGAWLKDCQHRRFLEMWAGKRGDPEKRQRFADKFFRSDVEVGPEVEDPWPFIRGVNLYDPVATMAGDDELLARFFIPEEVRVRSASGQMVAHLLIGLSPQKPGVRDGRALAKYLMTSIRQALLK